MVKKKVNKKELSFEEEQDLRIEKDIKRLKEDYVYVPEPTRLYNVGDEVSIGNLKNCKIERVIDGGKFYIINYTSINHNYGNPIETPNCKGVWMWTEVRGFNDGKSSFAKKNDIRINYSQRTIDSLLIHAYHFGFDLEPIYQRGLVWGLEDKIALMDSIFNNVDIGKFTFIKNGIMEKDEVLDGKQRLSTILEFYEDRFEYKGYKFSELSWRDKNHFTGYSISWGETSGLTEEQKLRYFIKLNTTGKPMDVSHINNIKNMINDSEIE